MRATVLKLSIILATLGATLGARADEDQWQIAAQNGEVWENSADGQASEPFADYCPDKPSWVRPRYWFLPPKFGTYFSADVLFLTRLHGATNQPIATNNPVMSQVVMTTENAGLDHQYRAGAMFTLGFNLDQVAQIEGTYWGLNTWQNSATVVDNSAFPSLGLAGSLQTVTSDFQLADRISENYTSRINNVEVNYKQTINGLMFLGGVRYFRMVEGFDISSQSGFTHTTSDYNVGTANNLIGLQFGAGYIFEWGPVSLSLTGKIGPYLNAVHQSTLLQDFGNTITLRNYNQDGMPVSTVAETNSLLVYRVTDWFSLHAGSRFLWIQNLAFAPDQLDLSNSPPGTHILNPHNHLWLQGFNIGGEFRW
jgi:hypothetical protein